MPQDPEAATKDQARASSFFNRGWCVFPHDDRLAKWIDQVHEHASATLSVPENAQWFRYQNTWFAGVNVLGNDGAGRVGRGGFELSCAATDFIASHLGLQAERDFLWDQGQVSVCYPGYPQPMDGESDGALRYRIKRDAAHLDGLHPVGTERRRYLREAHAFVLGIPLTEADEGASPLVVWDGSHELIREALAETFADDAPETWQDLDVTDVYQRARKRIFEECPRSIVHARPGECYLLHRLALHGVAPWNDTATASADGRMIIYFRPELLRAKNGNVGYWLNAA